PDDGMSALGEQADIGARAAAQLERARAGAGEPAVEQALEADHAAPEPRQRPARDEMVGLVPRGEFLEPPLPLALEATHGVSTYWRCQSSSTMRAQICEEWLRYPRWWSSQSRLTASGRT